MRRALTDSLTAPERQFVIDELDIDDVAVEFGSPHPERTPVGPFASKEEAWDYAAAMQKKYGSGGGSVGVSELHPPEVFEV